MRVVRTVAAVTALAGVLALGSCTSRPAIHDPTVTYLSADASLGYAQEMTMGFTAGASEIPGVAQSERGTAVGDTIRQVAMIRTLESQPHTGVTVFTWNPELLAEPLAIARNAGTPVIALHTPPAPGSGITLYVGNDNYHLGVMLAEQIATLIPPGMQGIVVLGTAVPGVATLDERTAGVRDWLTRLRPRLTLLGPFDTKQDPAANAAAWSTLVDANPAAVAFLGTGDTDAATLARLRSKTGGTWLSGGFGLDDVALGAVEAGRFALVSPELYVQGAVAGRLQAAAAKGDPLPEGWLVTPGLTITPGSVAAIRTRQSSARLRQLWADDEVDGLTADCHTHMRPLSYVPTASFS